MRTHRRIALALIVAATLIHSQFAFTDLSSNAANDENKPSVFAAIDYCYSGTIEDPITDERVDIYSLCPEDGFEQHIDFAKSDAVLEGPKSQVLLIA